MHNLRHHHLAMMYRQKEEFWDLTLSLTISGKPDKISVDTCLNEFCNPQAKDVVDHSSVLVLQASFYGSILAFQCT